MASALSRSLLLLLVELVLVLYCTASLTTTTPTATAATTATTATAATTATTATAATVSVTSSDPTTVVEKYSVNDVSKDQLCFLTAVSSNHLHTANAFLKSIQKFYPCGKTYVYDLGLKGWEKRLLRALPYVEDVMELVLPVRGKDYFPSGSCAFKPPMMLQFINKYLNNETNCRFTFYGDSVIFFHHKFNRKAFDEVKRLGIITQSPRRDDQISLTHPNMFPFFGFDREKLFHEGLGRAGRVMRQTQAGLMLVDASNTTMRDTFFTEWADCAANDDCLIPDKIRINKRPGSPLAIHNISGHRVFRAHRDDQSAFSFLVAKYFGYGGQTSQQVYLDSYVGTYWRQSASHVELKEAGANCTSSNVTFHKSIQGDHWGPNDTFDKSVQGDHRGPLLARARHGISKNKVSTVASPVHEQHSPPPRRILLPDMSVLQIQALLDFVVVIILGGLVGILFRKWNRYWESDLLSPAVDSVANRQESDTLLNKA